MCSGKCHIQKIIEDIKNDRDQWKKSAKVSIDERSITLINERISLTTLKARLANPEKAKFYYQQPYFVKFNQSVFRPPKSSFFII
jgi:hypothetical protein